MSKIEYEIIKTKVDEWKQYLINEAENDIKTCLKMFGDDGKTNYILRTNPIFFNALTEAVWRKFDRKGRVNKLNGVIKVEADPVNILYGDWVWYIFREDKINE